MSDHWCTYCQGINAHNCQFNTTLPRTTTVMTNSTTLKPESTTDLPEPLLLADAIDYPDVSLGNRAANELRRLHEENRRLKTVMVAAAEEISEHWDAHCGEDGYGPTNLMRRLEEGIPSDYGYTAGAFAKLREQHERDTALLRQALALLKFYGAVYGVAKSDMPVIEVIEERVK